MALRVAFGIRPNSPSSIPSLRVTLYFLFHRIQIVTHRCNHKVYQLYGANLWTILQTSHWLSDASHVKQESIH